MKPRIERKQYLSRLRRIREEVFGEQGISELATRLEIPIRTWENYESGVVIPDLILLEFLSLTGANPGWLITGFGEVYTDRPNSGRNQETS